MQRYGMLQWGDLFTARQKVGLNTLVAGVEGKSVATLSEPLRTLCYH